MLISGLFLFACLRSVQSLSSQPHLSVRETGLPDIKVHSLSSSLSRLIYFRDSPYLAYLTDTGKPDSQIWVSKDEGKGWTLIESIPKGKVTTIHIHPFAQTNTAFALTAGDTHYVTFDKGISWSEFKTPVIASKSINNALSFHATDPSRIMFRGRVCTNEDGKDVCHDDTYYTLDKSLKDWKRVMTWTQLCGWAQNANSDNSELVDRVVCSRYPPEYQRGNMDDSDPAHMGLFRTSVTDPNSSIDQILLGGGVPIFASTLNWIIAVVQLADKKTHLYTSKDGVTFRKAVFPDGVNMDQIAYTVLDSANSSLIIDVVKERKYGFGDLYRSNSEGTYFVKALSYTHRDMGRGLVDFERLQAPLFEGMMTANIVANWKRIEDRLDLEPELNSKISFDNGGHWNFLTPPAKDSNGQDWSCDTKQTGECYLHLHSVTSFQNVGKVFSTTAAPGIIIAIGSVGSKLDSYDSCDTFLSDDAGLTWRAIAKGPHKFEILNMGSVVVLLPESGNFEKIKVSYDRAKSWQEISIPFATKAFDRRALYTLTDPNSTSQKMLILSTQSQSSGPFELVYLDFSKSLNRQCDFNPDAPENSPDFEIWQPASRGGECLLGRQVKYFRRKADVDCYIAREFILPKPEVTVCNCNDADLECDVNFEPDQNASGLVCVEKTKVPDQPSDCKIGSTYNGLSGYRKIPGDMCQGQLTKLNPVTKSCERSQRGKVDPPSDMVPPTTTLMTIPGYVVQLIHIKKTKAALLRTNDGSIWVSSDGGAHWIQSPHIKNLGASIVRMGAHDTIPERIFFFSKTDIYVSHNALGGTGEEAHFEKFNLPERYNTLDIPVLDFHPKQSDWYVFVLGCRDCSARNTKCHTSIHATKDGGKNFYQVDTWANKCAWAWDADFEHAEIDDDAIYCVSYLYKDREKGQDELEKFPDEDNPAQLVLISKDGKERVVLVDKHVSDFYVVSGILVAAVGTSSTPTLYTSSDGQKVVSASFPPKMSIGNLGYTMLPSNTGGVYVNVIQSTKDSRRYGKLFKSNQNGEYFSLALDNTNIGDGGRVDFDTVHGMNGILLSNTVSNAGSLGTNSKKDIISRISYDAGITWSSLIPPKFDSLGERYACAGLQKCKLHLRSHAEEDSTHGLSVHSTQASAGLVIAVGNVGDKLLDLTGDVFLTRDGGRSWIEVAKEPHKWAIGNYGGLIILVNEATPVNHFKFSWDFGYSWAEHTFTDSPIMVQKVLSDPSPDSLLFTFVGIKLSISQETILIHVDFSQSLKRPCVRGEPGTSGSDFEYWQPKQDSPQACFFGERKKFVRRKADAVCRVGSDADPTTVNDGSCQCTEQDFECDVNFFRNEVGSCVLYGKDPEAEKQCKSNDGFYQSSSGYRKISLSKCSGGNALQGPIQRPCSQGLNLDDGKPNLSKYVFDGVIQDFMQFKNTMVILARDDKGNMYKSLNGGKTWQIIDSVKSITKAILEDPYWSDRAFLLTTEKQLWITENKASSFWKVEVPHKADFKKSSIQLSLHPKRKEWLLWTGISTSASCDTQDTSVCYTAAFVSFDYGYSWTTLGDRLQDCNWGTTSNFTSSFDERTLFCTQQKEGSSTSTLVKIVANSGNPPIAPLYNISGYAIVDQYLVAAAESSDNKDEVQVRVTLDGDRWASAKVGSSILKTKQGYTVLDSSTGSLFIHVNDVLSGDQTHGHILKSNWNGTFFTQVLDNVNQNSRGLADFEKVERLPGLLLANQLYLGQDGLSSLDSEKKVLTKMSWDDGAEWKRLAAPKLDSQQQSYDCGPDCYLNLHAYTERHDKRDEFSSSGSVGLMLGVGSVGRYLKSFTDSDTFMSVDAGATWVEITKDAHMIEIGDHGGIVLLANDEEPIDHIKYTLDGGVTFSEFELNEFLDSRKLRVKNIITEPSGTTSQFVVFGQLSSGTDTMTLESQTVALHLDFSHGRRLCQFLPDHPEKSDFESWELASGQCMFGSRTKYYRRKRGRNCQVAHVFKELPVEMTPCECTLDDFECDENYSLVPGTGECKLDVGKAPPEPVCNADGYKRYTSGYRKLFISSCSGGKALHEPVRIQSCGGAIPAGKVVSIVFGIFTALSGTLIILAFIKYPERLRHLWSDSHIRLADDEYGYSSNEPQWKRVIRTSGRVLLGLGAFIVLGAQVAIDMGYHGFDWLRARMNRSSGYTPLRTTIASGRFSHASDQHLDLNWDDQ